MYAGTMPRTEAMKRKLTLGPDEDSPRPAKAARTFTSTPEELVKLCGAFVQATSAACNSRLTPVKMMEGLIDRFEKARDKQAKMGAEVPSADQSAAAAAEGQAAANPVIQPGPPPAAPPASNNSRGGRGSRGRGGTGGTVARPSPAQVSGGAPVRCSYPAVQGTGYCMTPNFPEAEFCRTCGGRLSCQRSQAPNPGHNSGNRGHGNQGGRGSFRGRGWKGARGRRSRGF